jgi:uncharacterized membrane protein YcaP (DUF421 family)
MGPFGPVDWSKVFAFQTPLLELVARGTCVYLAIFLLLRVVLKRQTGSVRMADLLVIVLLSDAAQNAMVAEYSSVPDGIVLVATIIFWSYAIDWLGYKVPFIQTLVHPPPLPLVENGRLNRKNMRTELITEDELMTQLREQGVSDLSEVKKACMEGDGHISVITVEEKEKRQSPPDQPAK